MAELKKRIISLLDYAKDIEQINRKPIFRVEEHGMFSRYEHEIASLPGIELNVEDPNGDEVWLRVERLRATAPPEIENPILAPWVEFSKGLRGSPKKPNLRTSVPQSDLVYHREGSKGESDILNKRWDQPDRSVLLEEYELATHVQQLFSEYMQKRWEPWAIEESRRRKSIALYSDLFTLRQTLEGGIVESQIELVWGVGIAIWQVNLEPTGDCRIQYPLITQLVEINIDETTSRLSVKPRNVVAMAETERFQAMRNPQLSNFERKTADFYRSAETEDSDEQSSQPRNILSPFECATFESVLRDAKTHLAKDAQYCPDFEEYQHSKLPKVTEYLQITDSWVLFARPRNKHIYLNDLESFKELTEQTETLPPVLASLVTDPSDQRQDIELPAFRGVTTGESSTFALTNVRDAYFPHPFNEEQLQILQFLEKCDGVVVEGPPGTGKTHTIANIICHYMAHGKRVLVTSMKEPALQVLKSHFPKTIQPLVIALLTNDKDGQQQLAKSIHHIATGLQNPELRGIEKTIERLEVEIDRLHGSLADTDQRVGLWAKKNLTKIHLDGGFVYPSQAAKEVVEGEGEYEWFPDRLGIESTYDAKFGNEDIVALRQARRMLNVDLDYLGTTLPAWDSMPDTPTLLELHQQLCELHRLEEDLQEGRIPPLADASEEGLGHAQNLLQQSKELMDLLRDIFAARQSWVEPVRHALRRGAKPNYFKQLAKLGKDLGIVESRHADFISCPVSTPKGIEQNVELMKAVGRLANRQSPFGVMGVLGKKEQKKLLEEIQIEGSPPANFTHWKHVERYLQFLKSLRQFASRWNTVATELGLPKGEEDNPLSVLSLAQHIKLYRLVQKSVLLEREFFEHAVTVVSVLGDVRTINEQLEPLHAIQQILEHHLERAKLLDALRAKEKVQRALHPHSGRIVQQIRDFYSQMLGQFDYDSGSIQKTWDALLVELRRVAELGKSLEAVSRTTKLVADSGAPEFAELLRTKAIEGGVDPLLPDNWQAVWRLRRLATYMEEIDEHGLLQRSALKRRQLESDLAKTYLELVTKRIWQKLAERASPKVQGALQSYLNAIKRVRGERRGPRYRQAARSAVVQAKNAVPCWIMPHYRIAENMPVEFGDFDLVVVDEASQSNFTILPAILRAKKVLVVGDDKQVSPEGIGERESDIALLMNRHLADFPSLIRDQLSPDRSIYDLFTVLFNPTSVMLREHFRSVEPIIEYSKREFYNHELRPLRIPKASERIDPPLVDILVTDGVRKHDRNEAEAKVILDEIRTLTENQGISGRSIGVVTLLGTEQARFIWEKISSELGPDIILKHQIACGTPMTFQGNERDIMFVSLVVCPAGRISPLSSTMVSHRQRFNVAASRARDRMYLVRSVRSDQLGQNDLRKGLLDHFQTPFRQDKKQVEDLRLLCESDFERAMYDELVQRDYRVIPQVEVGQYRIDMVVEGTNDARLAIECDGDRFHGPDRWADDMRRQRTLERAGWKFWRCFASTFTRRRTEIIQELLDALAENGIDPIGAEGAAQSIHTERRVVRAFPEEEDGFDEQTEDDRFEDFVAPDDSDAPGQLNLFDIYSE